jgi:hypothetical protein
MKYAVETGSGAMLYTYQVSCVKIVSGIPKLIGEIHRHIDNMVIS